MRALRGRFRQAAENCQTELLHGVAAESSVSILVSRRDKVAIVGDGQNRRDESQERKIIAPEAIIPVDTPKIDNADMIAPTAVEESGPEDQEDSRSFMITGKADNSKTSGGLSGVMAMD